LWDGDLFRGAKPKCDTQQHPTDNVQNDEQEADPFIAFNEKSKCHSCEGYSQRGKTQEAHDLLAPIYAEFTEGFDTVDLVEGKTLLDALR